MIGSLWDLKRRMVETLKQIEHYHDRFPMGFETVYDHVLVGVVVAGYHDRFPMGFETENEETYFFSDDELS